MTEKNVVLLTIDCLRADHVGCLGYDRGTTPTIDRLADDGTLFTQAIAQGGTTQPSFQSILTSTYPLMFDTYRNFTQYRVPISVVLKKNGFNSAAFHENPQVSQYFGFERGFQKFDDFMSLDRKSEEGKSILSPVLKRLKGYLKDLMKDMVRESKLLQKFRRTPAGSKIEDILGMQKVAAAEEINAKAIDWLRSHRDEKFFLWLHYMDVHMPLIPPLKFLRQFSSSPDSLVSTGIKKEKESQSLSESEFEELINLYDSEVKHVDAAIKRIVDKLKEWGIFKNTILIITADHGEELSDHGQIGHTSESLYDEIVRVPLIFHNADLENSVVDSQVELLDIAPTILDCLGLDAPKSYLGTSLAERIQGGSEKKRAVSEYGDINEEDRVKPGTKKVSWRTEKWKFIYDEKTKNHELYNISVDPEESKNLYESEEGISRELKSKVKEHLRIENKFAERIRTNTERERIMTKAKEFGKK